MSEVKVLTNDERAIRNNEIVRQFGLMNRLNDKGFIRSVKTKEGAWTSDVYISVMNDVRPVILESFGLKANFPLGEECAKWQEGRGKVELAQQIREVTAIMEKVIEDTLEEDFGMLAELQSEFWDNLAIIKGDAVVTSADKVASALDKIRAKRAQK